jgi:hypothetical protein
MRTRGQPPIALIALASERERRAQIGPDALALGRLVDLVLADGVQEAADVFGALGGVVGQVASDLAARRAVVKGGSLRSPPAARAPARSSLRAQSATPGSAPTLRPREPRAVRRTR